MGYTLATMDSIFRSIGTQTPTEKLSFTFPDVSPGLTPDCNSSSSTPTKRRPPPLFNPGLDCAEDVGKLLRAIADDFARIRTRSGGGSEQHSPSNESSNTNSPWLKTPRQSCVRT